MDEELKYKLAISMVQGINPVLINSLIEHSGSLNAFFKDDISKLSLIPSFRNTTLNNINRGELLAKANKELDFCRKNDIRIISCEDADYPKKLLQCPDYPSVLYCKGNTNLNHCKILSVVGTRRATNYGKNICNEIIHDLKNLGHNFIVVSGLAYGIDVAAHKAALESNLQTIGVVAHGLNQLYPAAHKNIAHKMVDNGGAILSDFPTLAFPEPRNFIKRNRIIAGLADVILVIESAEKGGSMITASLANAYNRDVCAIPGKTNDKYSLGCNKLIKSNMASLVECAKDVEYICGWEADNIKIIEPKLTFANLNKEEDKIISFIEKNGKSSVNTISNNTKIPLSRLLSILLSLELRNLIFSLPGNLYVKSL